MNEIQPLYELNYLESPSDLAIVQTINKKMGSFDYSIWEGQLGKYFMPNYEVSVSAKSKRTDEANKFISYLLSNEDTSNIIDGFPVNKKSLEKNMNQEVSKFSEDGETGKKLEINPLSDDEKNKFMDKITSLNSKCYKDKVILNQVSDIICEYIEGKNDSLEGTMEKVKSKLEMYLQE